MPDTPSELYFREIATLYDMHLAWPDEPFFREMARRYDSPVLELGCGTGRITMLFAEAGREIIGIDLSHEMIEIAKAKLEKMPDDVQSRATLQFGDITNFHLGRKFPLIIIPSSFKFLLTKEDQLACLKCAQAHLTHNGVFILDLYPGEAYQADGTQTTTQEIDGKIVTYTETHSNDLNSGLRTWKFLYEVKLPDGKIEYTESSATTALITPQEAEALLELAGLQIIEDYGGWDFSPYTHSSWRRILFLKKKWRLGITLQSAALMVLLLY
jgi:SAM-dependent methyltransferase